MAGSLREVLRAGGLAPEPGAKQFHEWEPLFFNGATAAAARHCLMVAWLGKGFNVSKRSLQALVFVGVTLSQSASSSERVTPPAFL